MNEMKYRHECKHTINLLDYHSLKQRIKSVTSIDRNAGVDGRYRIRSLYFDNDNDKALREKLYGLPNREKFRIRIYNGSADCVKLEKKSKLNGLCNKQSATLSADETLRIISGDTEWMRNSTKPLIVEFYAKMNWQRLKPRTIVDYWREAYIYTYGNVRITFDSDVRTGLYSTGLFEFKLPLLSVNKPGLMLMEVKYDDFLPDIMRDLIQTNTRCSEPFSKYAVCRIYG